MSAASIDERLRGLLNLPNGARTRQPFPAGHELVVCVDTMIEGVHFPPDTTPDALACKALAVNLSDLAAMGATPLYGLLALCPGECDDGWLTAFSDALLEAAERHRLRIAAVATAAGPLAVSLELHGAVAAGSALRRAGARAGDRIYVTGTLGDAACALAIWRGGQSANEPEHARVLRQRLDRPSPRLQAGATLRGIASACIDVSDGLAADLGHVLEASGVGATVQLEQLPLSRALLASVPREQALALALTGGDDYELCFTVAPEHEGRLAASSPYMDCALRCIGEIDARPGLRCVDASGRRVSTRGSWMHFE